MQPMIQKQADCISVMTYNEYGQALDAGFSPDNLTIFNYTEMGNDLLEDGLYVAGGQRLPTRRSRSTPDALRRAPR